MKITGIIAEYNPFHNGHAYQIAKIKEETDSDYVIVAMSGDFVQRGEPAITDKYERARMALSCGADLVLELPAHFCLRFCRIILPEQVSRSLHGWAVSTTCVLALKMQTFPS